MTHRDRAGNPSGQRAGRREAAGDAGTSARLSDARPFARCRFACATGTAASQGFRTASRMARDAPHRRATRVLAESLGKPSLWVIISAPWYKLLCGTLMILFAKASKLSVSIQRLNRCKDPLLPFDERVTR